MSHVEVIFTRRRALGSLALRTYMWSQWSHCGIVDGDHVIHASTHGVVRVPMSEFMHGVSKSDTVKIRCPDPQAVINAAKSQLGAGYDWFGVFGILARFKLQTPNRWFCSELVAWAFEEAGYPIFRVKFWRITPRDLYLPIFAP